MTLFEKLRGRILAILKVPHEPEPPLGAPESIRVFRAGRNYYKLRLLGWSVGQFFALLGIVFWVGVLAMAEREARLRHEAEAMANAVPPPSSTEVTAPTNQSAILSNSSTEAAPSKQKNRSRPRNNPKEEFAKVVSKLPAWVFPVMWTLKIVFFFVYLGQAAVTYSLLRLDYEQRWYVVTDRSLRIRSGLWSVQEITMSFANLQHVAMSQGPLQRLLGISDVRVQSAGGGANYGQKGHDNSLHTGVFHGVDNAKEIRDLILERLRLFRETGLGDPDEAKHAVTEPTSFPAHALANSSTLAAAQELLGEARALRRLVG